MGKKKEDKKKKMKVQIPMAQQPQNFAESTPQQGEGSLRAIPHTTKQVEPIHDISQLQVEIPCSPQQQGAIPRTTQQQETISHHPQQHAAIPCSPQQQIAISPSPQQQGAIPRTTQQQETISHHPQQQAAIPCSPQQQIAISPSPQQQGAIPCTSQQAATPVSRQQQGDIPRTSQEEEATPFSPQQQAAILSYFQQQGDIPHIAQQQLSAIMSISSNSIYSFQEAEDIQQSRSKKPESLLDSAIAKRGAVKEPKGIKSPQREEFDSPQSENLLVDHQSQPSSPAAHDDQPEIEISIMHDPSIIQAPEDTDQPEPKTATSHAAAMLNNHGISQKVLTQITFFLAFVLLIILAVNQIVQYTASTSHTPIYSRLTANENEAYNPKLSEVTKHLQQLYGKEYNPCNSLYTLACDALHKRSEPELLEWPVKSINNITSQMETIIQNWVTDKQASKGFTHNFDIVKKFYQICMKGSSRNQGQVISPDENSKKYFKELLNITVDAVTSKHSAWVDLTAEALKVGLFGYVFIELSMVDTDGGLAIFEVTLPSTVTNDKYMRIWQATGFENIKRLTDSFKLSIERNKKFEEFAVSIRNIVQSANDHPKNYQLKPPNHLKASSFMRELTGSENPRFKISSNVFNYIDNLNILISKTEKDIVVNYFKIMVIIHDCIYLPDREKNGCRYFHERPFTDICYSIARNSSWFQGVHVFQYADKYITDTNVHTINSITYTVKETLARRLKADRWLNSIAVNGALKHLYGLTVVLGWEPSIKTSDYEQKSYPHLYSLHRDDYMSLIHFVTRIRSSYTKAQISKTDLPAYDVEIVNQFQRPHAVSDWTNYHPLTGQLAVNPVVFEMLLSNDKKDLPFYYHMATLGPWIATGILKTFDFRNSGKDSCIILSEFWKYNIQLYSNNLKNCTEIQYNEYASNFDIKEANTQLMFDSEDIFDIIGPRLAFSAYQNFVKAQRWPPEPVHVADLTAEQAFWLILTSCRCESNSNLSTDYLRTNFSVVGPAFTSKEFDSAFKCHKHSKMLSRHVCLSFQV